MDSTARGKLEELAWERMNATADDEEQWSFAFRTEGAVDFPYCPWFVTEEWEFHGELDDLELPWSADRRAAIAKGEDQPTEDELNEWRRAMCRKLAPGSDWSWVAWIVPLWIEGQIGGYAAFTFDPNLDPDDPPELNGVFDSLEAAKTALMADGALIDKG